MPKRTNTIHVVMFSGGVGSWATAKRVAEKHGTKNLKLLFADTKMEDEDLYRFLDEAAGNVGGELIKLAEGRDPWQVFFDERYLGNNRIDPCSRILKREFLRKYIDENFDPKNTVIYLGIDWSEIHRFDRAQEHWKPWKTAAPMCEKPYYDKEQMLEWLKAEGIKIPRLYRLGFQHNNCTGCCVKAGQAQWRLVLEKMPKRYKYHEDKEQEIRKYLKKDVTILRVQRGGVKRNMSLKDFRKAVEAKKEGSFYDPHDLGGCACFTPDDYAKDAKKRKCIAKPADRMPPPTLTSAEKKKGLKLYGAAVKSDLDSKLNNFKIGEWIELDLLGRKRAPRESNILREVTALFKCSLSKAYDFLYLYRGAKYRWVFSRRPACSQEYWETIGRRFNGYDYFTHCFALFFGLNPIGRKGKADLKGLTNAAKLIKHCLRRLEKEEVEIPLIPPKIWAEHEQRIKKAEKAKKTSKTKKGKPIPYAIEIEVDPDDLRRINDEMYICQSVISSTLGRCVEVIVNPKIKRIPKRPKQKYDSAEGAIYHLDEFVAGVEAGKASKEAKAHVAKRIKKGNALEVIPTLPKASIDVVLTDPPYGQYNAWKQRTKQSYQEEKNVHDAAQLASSAFRLMIEGEKFRSTWAWMQFCPLETVHIFLPPLLAIMQEHKIAKYTAQVLVWDKTAAHTQPVNGHHTYARQAEAIIVIATRKILQHHHNLFSVPSTAKKDKLWKPVELLEQLIRIYCPADSTQRVLDPFAGRGPTALAAKRVGVDYSLIEVDDGQHATAKTNLLRKKRKSKK